MPAARVTLYSIEQSRCSAAEIVRKLTTRLVPAGAAARLDFAADEALVCRAPTRLAASLVSRGPSGPRPGWPSDAADRSSSPHGVVRFDFRPSNTILSFVTSRDRVRAPVHLRPSRGAPPRMQSSHLPSVVVFRSASAPTRAVGQWVCDVHSRVMSVA
jgi:hypothetical protein